MNCQNLSSLPVDGCVMDDLTTEETAEESCPPIGEQYEDLPPASAIVPDFTADENELELLRLQVQPERQHLSMPSFRSTPVQEFNSSQPILSWAFPTLYPTGQADFLAPRTRTVSFANYVTDLLKYFNGRFARHTTWRYVVFNTLMR